MIHKKIGRISTIYIAFQILTLLAMTSYVFSDTGVMDRKSTDNPPSDAIIRLGERMYRDGILPSGEPMKAYVSGDIPVTGSAFSCVSCHLRSGLGSIEGGVVTPPTNGRILYRERKPYIKGMEFVPLIHNYAVYLPVRPAYTDETLAHTLRTGQDPTGRMLSSSMPRYQLSDQDMKILITYLKSLSDKPAPGVSNTSIKFATVIVEGADPLAVQSMLTPLQFTVDRKNSLATAAQKNDRVARMGYNMLGSLSQTTFSLSKWILKGPSSTWRQQLEDYYKAEPVFAILGGISTGDWEPVHRFCEDFKIPNLMPVTEYPVISGTDWYTLYPSRGIRQEGEAAARYLNSLHELFKGKTVLQITRQGSRGQALAEGFMDIWAQSGHGAPNDITLKENESLSPERIKQIVSKYSPAAILIWDNGASLKALSEITKMSDGPKLIIASGTYLDRDIWSIPTELREILYITYPYRLPDEDSRFDPQLKKIVPGKDLKTFDYRILRQAFIAGDILGKALMEMRGEYYRDFFLDVIGMMSDMYYPLYERVSFGPGQRYASKGCFIVKLNKGDSPKLERHSEWTAQ